MHMEEREIVKNYVEAKYPGRQIRVLADLNACSAVEIKEILKNAGALEPRRHSRRGRKASIDAEKAYQLYKEGFNDAAIARETGVSRMAVARWRYSNGLPGNLP